MQRGSRVVHTTVMRKEAEHKQRFEHNEENECPSTEHLACERESTMIYGGDTVEHRPTLHTTCMTDPADIWIQR